MPDTPTTARAIADELREHQLAHDHDRALRQGDVDHVERWSDYSAGGIGDRLAVMRDIADRADATPAASRSEQNLLDAVAFSARSEALYLEIAPTLTGINPAVGMVATILTFLPRYPLVTADHGARYHEKLRAFPDFIEGWCDRLRAAAADGVVPIRHLVQAQITLLDAMLAGPLSAGQLAAQRPPTELDADAAARWSTTLHGLLDGPVTQGFAHLRATLAEHTLPAALPDDRPGIMHLEGGREAYDRFLWAATSLDMTAEQIHHVGLEQVARVEAEYLRIAAPVLGTDDIAEIYRRLRDDPALHYRDGDAVISDATEALARATAAAPGWFGTLPVAPCTAHPTIQGGIAFYSPPTREGTKDGEFFVNVADPANWGTFQLQAMTFHESVPGHHLQHAVAQEMPGLHPLLAENLVISYGEGWALYTERLADEMGLYASDLDRIGMLWGDSARSCRLVVDTGLHALGWTRDQAIDYMLDHAPMTRAPVTAEIDRYIGWPGQACGYMLGRVAIEEIRRTAEARLGDRFDIRVFHDQVLGTGSIPLESLRRTIDEWIDGVDRAG